MQDLGEPPCARWVDVLAAQRLRRLARKPRCKQSSAGKSKVGLEGKPWAARVPRAVQGCRGNRGCLALFFGNPPCGNQPDTAVQRHIWHHQCRTNTERVRARGRVRVPTIARVALLAHNGYEYSSASIVPEHYYDSANTQCSTNLALV